MATKETGDEKSLGDAATGGGQGLRPPCLGLEGPGPSKVISGKMNILLQVLMTAERNTRPCRGFCVRRRASVLCAGRASPALYLHPCSCVLRPVGTGANTFFICHRAEPH